MSKRDLDSVTAQVIANIRTLRRAHGLTTEQLAERMTAAGISIGRVGMAKLECGYRAGITVAELVAFASILDIEPELLLKPLVVRTDVTAVGAAS